MAQSYKEMKKNQKNLLSEKKNGEQVQSGGPIVFKKDKDGNKIEVFNATKEGKKLSSIYKNVTEWRKFTEQKKVGGFKNSAVEKIMTGKGWIESHDISIDD